MAGLFTEQAAVYAAARPAYPKDLFAKLSAFTAHHRRAWDIGTGNGQAAIGVSMHLNSQVPAALCKAASSIQSLHV
jgi:methylase of polypeptide subunit release factors